MPNGCLECEHVPPAIAHAVRQLQHLPDLDLLLPGDLILTSPLTPTSVQGLIQKDQWDGGYRKDKPVGPMQPSTWVSTSIFARPRAKAFTNRLYWLPWRHIWYGPDAIRPSIPILDGK